MPQDPTDDKSTLVQVMALGRFIVNGEIVWFHRYQWANLGIMGELVGT